jgi:hypothetical protein
LSRISFDRWVSRIGGIDKLGKFDEFAAAMTVPDKGMNQIDTGQQTDRAVAFIFAIALDGLASR